jgi:hypothetical protein
MPNQEELTDINAAVIAIEDESQQADLSEEARVAFALYLDVMKKGKVTKSGTKVPALNTHKISRMAEVSSKQVAKGFDRLRSKGFLSNDENGELYIPDINAFEDWLRLEGAAID